MHETAKQQIETQKAAIEAKLKLAQEHLNLASQLMKEVGNDSVTAANVAHAAGVDVPMQDAHGIRQQADEHYTVMGEIGYGLGKMLGLVTLFFAGAMAAGSVEQKHPYDRAR